MDDQPDSDGLQGIWEAFQAQGGDTLAPNASLEPATQHGPQPGQDSTPDTDLRPLRLTGPNPDFTAGELLGRGGMGEVHVAVDHALRREVALKTTGPERRQRVSRALLDEALFTGYLEHPNVVPVHRLGRDADGRPAFVMKRISGTSWRELLNDPDHSGWESLPRDRLRANLEILEQVCNAVHFAHSRGVLHRDIKPDNVMVGSFGEVYLLDWGLAIRLDQLATAPDAIVGTLAYMAPEMLEQPVELTTRTDVYLLGATLHHVLTGEPRHQGSAHYNVMLKVHASEPVEFPDDVPRDLAELCNQATHRDPEQRPASALELRQHLERFGEHRGSVTLTDRAHERLAALEVEYSDRVFSECRFAFEQALAIWPGNPRAQAGLQRCLELVIERELAARNRGRVESLLATLPQARPDLEARLADLRAELDAASTAPARLEELERDLDIRVGSKQRAAVVVAMGLFGFGPVLALPFLFKAGLLTLSHASAFGFGLLVGVMMLVHLALGRRVLLANRANRQLVLMVAAGWLAAMVHLALCWVYAVEMWILITYVGLILAMVAMQMAVVVDRRLWFVAGLAVLPLFSGVVSKDHDPLLLSGLAGLVIMGVLAWIWYRDAKP